MYRNTTNRLIGRDSEDLGHLIAHIVRETALYVEKHGHAPDKDTVDDFANEELDRMDRDEENL